MATLHPDVNMPKLRSYFDNELPKIKSNSSVWSAFLKWSGHQISGSPSARDAESAALNVIAASKAVKVNLMHTITADPNTANTERSANGIFYTKTPDCIFIKLGIAYFYNQNIDSSVQAHKDLAIQLLESTCLHEFVHLLNYKHHSKVRGFQAAGGTVIGEMGKEFEKEAYGRDIGNEGWMRAAAAAGAAIPAIVAAGMQVYEGTIARVDLSPPVLVVTNSAGRALSHKLSPNVVVTIDGQSKTLSDLRQGLRVRVTPVRIEALDRNQAFAD
jgi:hypothetical protein